MAAREQQLLSSQQEFQKEREAFAEQVAELEAARDELSDELAETASKLDSVIEDRDSTKHKLAELTERFKKEVSLGAGGDCSSGYTRFTIAVVDIGLSGVGSVGR